MNRVLKQLALGCLIGSMVLILPALSKSLGYVYGFWDVLFLLGLAYSIYCNQIIKSKLLSHNHVKAQLLHVVVFSLLYITCNGIYLYRRHQLYKGIPELYYCILFSLLQLVLCLRVKASYEKSYEAVLSFENYLVCLGLCIVLSHWLNVKAMILMVFAVTLIYWLLQNQSSLEGLLTHTSYNTSMLHKMKVYNLKCILGASVFFILAYVLYGAVYKGFRLIGKLMTNGLVYLLSLLNEEAEATLAEPVQYGTMPSLPMEQAQGSHWLDYLVLSVVIFLILWKHQTIWEGFKKASKHLTNFLKQLVQRMKQKLLTVTHQELTEVKDYQDVSEFYNKITAVSSLEIQTEKQWRRQLKAFWKISDEVKKYKRGYYLLIEAYRLKGIPLTNSVTPREASQKVDLGKKGLKKGAELEEGIKEETRAYETLCYEEKPVSLEALKQLENHLRQIKW